MLSVKRSKELLCAFASAALGKGTRTFGVGCTYRNARGLQCETGLLILPCPLQGCPGTAAATVHQAELSQPPKTLGQLLSGTAPFFCSQPRFALFTSGGSEEKLNCSTSGQRGKGRVSLVQAWGEVKPHALEFPGLSRVVIVPPWPPGPAGEGAGTPGTAPRGSRGFTAPAVLGVKASGLGGFLTVQKEMLEKSPILREVGCNQVASAARGSPPYFPNRGFELLFLASSPPFGLPVTARSRGHSSTNTLMYCVN